eukprot:s564_g13.t1
MQRAQAAASNGGRAMEDPFHGTVKVISVGMSSPEKDREPETSMRTQQEQLQMWLVQEETCLQQHLAQVEQLFEEVLDVRLNPQFSDTLNCQRLNTTSAMLRPPLWRHGRTLGKRFVRQRALRAGAVPLRQALITLSGHTQVSSDNAATRRGNR